MKRFKKLLLGLVTLAAMAVLCAVCAGAERYGDYEYSVLADGTVEITRYYGSATTLSIPAKIDGKRVTSIDDWAFSYCSSLKSITIPDSVTSIGCVAFSDCSSLTSITIPGSVTSIESGAFSETPLLNKQTTTIKYVGKWAVECDDDAESAVIKSGTVGIANLAFYDCSNLTSITIPDSVKNIGSNAFCGCSGLTSITIPGSVTSIGHYPFGDCSALTAIKVSKNNKYYISDNGVLFNKNKSELICYPTGKTDKSYSIPDSVISIGDDAFPGCSSLTSITIPDSVISIGERAFYGYSSLTSITIPDSVKNIGSDAFCGCSGLTSITIPDSVTSIGYGAFSDCSGLTSVTIPDSVTSIGNYALGYKDIGSWQYEKIPGFKITCYSGTAGEKYAKNNGFAYTLLTPAPKAVTGFKLGGRASTELRLNWNKNTSADGYIVEQYKNNQWVRIARIASNATTAYRVSGLSAGTAYKFRIQAYKMSGKTALYGKYSTLAVRTNPSNVSGFALSDRTSSSLRLNWTKNTSADGYIIEQYKNNQWVRIARIASNATTAYRVSGLSAGTAYKFRIQAYKMSGSTALYGKYSTLAARTNPSNVSGFALSDCTSSSLRLNWTKNTSADGYIIEMYRGGKWVRIARIAGNDTVTYRVSGLAGNTAYQFRIKAYKMSGSTALYSGYTTISGKTTA